MRDIMNAVICLIGAFLVAIFAYLAIIDYKLTVIYVFLIAPTSFGYLYLLFRSALHASLKAGISVCICCAAIFLFAKQDFFGFKEVGSAYTGANSEQSIPVPSDLAQSAAPPKSKHQIHIASTDDSIKSEIVKEVNDALAQDHLITASRISVDGDFRLQAQGGHRFTWALARDGTKVWCGVLTSDAGSDRAAAQNIVRAVRRAASASERAQLACF